MNQVYAFREPPLKMSATTISSFSDCEQRFAYERLYAGVPAVAKPLPMFFGIVIHVFNKRLWDSPKDAAEGIRKYGIVFLKNALDGAHAPQSESEPPVSIQWFTKRRLQGCTAEEIREKIEEEKKLYMARGWLALEALYLERIAPFPFLRTEVEFNIGTHNIVIKDNHASLALHLSGFIDRIHFFEDGTYSILDVKTGGARRTYRRNKLVRDIQMTVYQLAGYRIFKHEPKSMFLLALGDVTKDILDRARDDVRRGRIPESLNGIRIPVEIREPVHYTNLARIAADVRSVIRMVLHPDEFDQWEFREWEPLSDWGKLASFGDNIREKRFIPRIGEAWCEDCPFLELCQHDNREDWETYQASLSVARDPEALDKKAILQAPIEMFLESLPEPQVSLFPVSPKQKPLRKSDREIRRAMLDSGNFLKPQGVRSLVCTIQKLIPSRNGEFCPCRRLNLIPIAFLDRISDYRKGVLRLSDLVAACPYEECPVKAPLPR